MKENKYINCEWGINAIKKYLSNIDIVIIVDVFSFSTCVEIACSRDAFIYPYKRKDKQADKFVLNYNAILAGKRSYNDYSLSPYSLRKTPRGTRLVLSSPNGAALSLNTRNRPTLTGCFRNAKSVAKFASKIGGRVLIIPAGEKWEDGSIRFAVEDFLCAGVIISYLRGECSAEASFASSVFKKNRKNLNQILKNCHSGKELIERGFEKDVKLSSELNVSSTVPILKEGVYINSRTRC